jgi:hypothetical protein
VDPGAESGRSRDAGLLLDAHSASAPPSLAAATAPPPALLALHTRNVSYSIACLSASRPCPTLPLPSHPHWPHPIPALALCEGRFRVYQPGALPPALPVRDPHTEHRREDFLGLPSRMRKPPPTRIRDGGRYPAPRERFWRSPGAGRGWIRSQAPGPRRGRPARLPRRAIKQPRLGRKS